MADLGQSLIDALVSAHEAVFPRRETGLGLRPQSDQALAILRDAMRLPGQAGQTARTGLLAPGTTTVSMGPRFWGDVIPNLSMNLTERLQPGQVTAGFWNPSTQNITLRPGGLRQFYGFDPGLARAVAPHEIFHMLRTRTGLDVGDEPAEEAQARLASGRPLTEAAGQLGGDVARAAAMRPEIRKTIRAAVPTGLEQAAKDLGIQFE